MTYPVNDTVFINRELSWLAFNERVLFEAEEKENPVLERLKFISIVSSNLEEFFMIRVAVLKKQKEAGLADKTMDSMTPQEQLSAIRERVLRLLDRQYGIFRKTILPELETVGIRFLLGENEILPYRDILENVFRNAIQPLLTPLSVDPTHPFPILVTGRMYLAVELRNSGTNRLTEKKVLSFIEIPSKVTGRFIKIGEEYVYAPVESVIRLFIQRMFQGYEVVSSGLIMINRDADFSLQEDGASDLLNEIESTIKRMHHRSVVKVEYEKGLSPAVLKTVMAKNGISEADLYEMDGILRLQDLMSLTDKIERNDLKYETINPVYTGEFAEKDVFRMLDGKSPLLFHPYHSYDPVVDLLNRAADDPDVLAIKQTLYRTSSNSSIIQALVRAAENGKYVTVVDELRARFDEKRNIEWARKLEDAGAHVIYGVKGLKTHAKALLIVRKNADGSLRRYIHLGTGNYNETTAKMYTDFSLFTSDEKTGEDIAFLFNLLTGFSYTEKWNRITLAPISLRQKFIELILRETDNAKKGLKAEITAKMNSLSDPEIIRALYGASTAGVRIRLIIRGICCLVPGVKGMSENISVISIVGRYLEHSRIFVFHNAGDTEFYLSSADWMNRNMDRRVEILFPVTGADNRRFITKILELQFEDSANCWRLEPDGRYTLLKDEKTPVNDSFRQIQRFVKESGESRKKKNPVLFEPNRSAEE